VATAPSKGQDGTDTVLTEMCFSRLGTGPMWPFTRFVSFHESYVRKDTHRIVQQVLQQHALDVAKTYRSDQQLWLNAAQNLRAPFWDWATNSVPPPEVVSLQTVNITTPDGKTSSVPNPLLQYTFNPIDPSFPRPWGLLRTTIRSPTSSASNVTDVQRLIRYDFTLPNPTFSHLFFSTKVICRPYRVT
jgi:hypothetical protein